MKTIWKWNLDFTHVKQEVEMPAHSHVIHVGEQRGSPCIWYTADTKEVVMVTRTFIMVGTGHEMPSDPVISYWNTVKFDDDYLVFHIFEIGSPEHEEC